MAITSTYTTIPDYILDQLWGFASANALKSDVQYLYERFAGSMEQGTSVGIGGLAISASCGVFSTTSITQVDVTNLSVTIITSGRPILVGLVADGTGSSYFGISKTSAASASNIYAEAAIFNGTTEVAKQLVYLAYPTSTSSAYASNAPSSSLKTIDIQTQGTFTYKVKLNQNINSGGGAGGDATAWLAKAKLYAFEL